MKVAMNGFDSTHCSTMEVNDESDEAVGSGGAGVCAEEEAV